LSVLPARGGGAIRTNRIGFPAISKKSSGGVFRRKFYRYSIRRRSALRQQIYRKTIINLPRATGATAIIGGAARADTHPGESDSRDGFKAG
jgi:hypothetical protein